VLRVALEGSAAARAEIAEQQRQQLEVFACRSSFLGLEKCDYFRADTGLLDVIDHVPVIETIRVA